MTAATATQPFECEVCHDEPGVTALAVPGVPMTVAYGQRCLDADVHPYDIVVGNTADIGGLDKAAAWWRELAERTCAYLHVPPERFEEDVQAAMLDRPE